METIDIAEERKRITAFVENRKDAIQKWQEGMAAVDSRVRDAAQIVLGSLELIFGGIQIGGKVLRVSSFTHASFTRCVSVNIAVDLVWPGTTVDNGKPQNYGAANAYEAYWKTRMSGVRLSGGSIVGWLGQEELSYYPYISQATPQIMVREIVADTVSTLQMITRKEI